MSISFPRQKVPYVLMQKTPGGDNNLGVALAPYEPHVECPDASIGPPGSTVPPLKSCEAIANLMFATKGLNSFGKAGSGAQVIVPATDSCKAHYPIAVTSTLADGIIASSGSSMLSKGRYYGSGRKGILV